MEILIMIAGMIALLLIVENSEWCRRLTSGIIDVFAGALVIAIMVLIVFCGLIGAMIDTVLDFLLGEW